MGNNRGRCWVLEAATVVRYLKSLTFRNRPALRHKLVTLQHAKQEAEAKALAVPESAQKAIARAQALELENEIAQVEHDAWMDAKPWVHTWISQEMGAASHLQEPLVVLAGVSCPALSSVGFPL
eukprot:TRINITY_DN67818_c5_g8_i1.p1 TRINITY_DN67818_c5_g8~~TRINITY_DN67818_c5_g8_i1.p1  ORF type:complete len:124 (+),score=14.66 TRINITY_DN67818_c5_g8_i1:329-700(+)